MHRILEKFRIVPNAHLVTVEAPQIAAKAQPGQFLIVMVDERSERIPFTLADWDSTAGTVTFVFNEVGRSTGKLAACAPGDDLFSVVGPLGKPVEIEKVKTVVCAGGCYGIAAIMPVAREFRRRGSHVISIMEARTAYLLYWQQELRRASSELVVATGDGSRGMKGFAPEAIQMLIETGQQIDLVVAIGCTFMLKTVSDVTRQSGIRTMVDLSPIMVDATGMCGCCRVEVGGETKFACVDGPFFDGHQVDWELLGFRKAAYLAQERDSVQLSEALRQR